MSTKPSKPADEYHEFSTSEFRAFRDIYAAEFNQPELHDRVLVLDVLNGNFQEEIVPKSRDIHIKHGELPAELPTAMPTACTSIRGKTRSNGTLNLAIKRSEKRRASTDTNGMSLRSHKVPKIGCDGATTSSVKGQGHHSIFVHTSWLSVHSKYFRALFHSGLKESHLKEVHMKILKSEEAAHLHLIKAMYQPEVLTNLPVEELLMILKLADKYDAKFVYLKCKYALKATVVSVHNCEAINHVIKVEHDMPDVDDLVDTIQMYLGKVFSPLDMQWELPSFENLSENLVTLLLSSSNLMASCEDVVFHALMHWITMNIPKFGISKTLSTSQLLAVVRFSRLSVCYLQSVVQHHPIATQMANFKDYYIKAVNYAALPDSVTLDAEWVNTRPHPCHTWTLFVQFHWKMPEKVVLNSLSTMQSMAFWACGHHMMLHLHRKYHVGERYTVSITLQLLNLKKDSYACLDWKIECNKAIICKQDDGVEDEFVFTFKNSKHMKEGSFTWKGNGDCELHLFIRPFPTSVSFLL